MLKFCNILLRYKSFTDWYPKLNFSYYPWILEYCKFQTLMTVCTKKHTTIEWGELGHWCELGQKFSESSPLELALTSHG